MDKVLCVYVCMSFYNKQFKYHQTFWTSEIGTFCDNNCVTFCDWSDPGITEGVTAPACINGRDGILNCLRGGIGTCSNTCHKGCWDEPSVSLTKGDTVLVGCSSNIGVDCWNSTLLRDFCGTLIGIWDCGTFGSRFGITCFCCDSVICERFCKGFCVCGHDTSFWLLSCGNIWFLSRQGFRRLHSWRNRALKKQ